MKRILKIQLHYLLAGKWIDAGFAGHSTLTGDRRIAGSSMFALIVVVVILYATPLNISGLTEKILRHLIDGGETVLGDAGGFDEDDRDNVSDHDRSERQPLPSVEIIVKGGSVFDIARNRHQGCDEIADAEPDVRLRPRPTLSERSATICREPSGLRHRNLWLRARLNEQANLTSTASTTMTLGSE